MWKTAGLQPNKKLRAETKLYEEAYVMNYQMSRTAKKKASSIKNNLNETSLYIF
jgi:hypothetical protein